MNTPGLLGHYGVCLDSEMNRKYQEANVLVDQYNSTVYTFKTTVEQCEYQKKILDKINLLIHE